jgi:hypothetical protein
LVQTLAIKQKIFSKFVRSHKGLVTTVMSYTAVPDDDEKTKIQSGSSAAGGQSRNWKKVKPQSSHDMIVYEYDLAENIYKPYMASQIKLGEGFPQREITQMFAEIKQNYERPPKIRRILTGRLLNS